jgi:hypothetical protein
MLFSAEFKKGWSALFAPSPAVTAPGGRRPVGFSGPIEPLRRDYGVIVAQTTCTSPLLGGQVGECMTVEACNQLPNSIGITSRDCSEPTPICCFTQG